MASVSNGIDGRVPRWTHLDIDSESASMFEDSLVESRVVAVSTEKRWTAVASFALQAVLAAVVIALPLLHPEALPFRYECPPIWMPHLPKPPVQVVETERAPSSAASDFAPPSESRRLIFTQAGAETATNDRPMLAPIGSGMVGSTGVPFGLALGEGHGPAVSVVTPKPQAGPLKISSGLSEGMLLTPIRPVYPAIARSAGIQGTVVVEAVISKMGTVESLRVVSGPLMLQNAALEAIREARYRPYRLNGEAVNVETTFTVNFRIGG
jgi:periplasmic protein TonB